ncbi:hypothetical protein [Hwanghaeella sp.]|uniref:hypothetical protein n=1 Tax=Hwanghaeella sp. TaxID=2605943 RepID=UPI003CCC32FC
MAATPITIDPITSVGTTEQRLKDKANPGSDGIAVAANEEIVISCSVGPHSTDSIFVKLYRSAQVSGVTKWFEVPARSFEIEPGDEDEHEIFWGVGGGPFDIGVYASGSTDTPTVTFTAKKDAVN